jgi:hypothetical protein
MRSDTHRLRIRLAALALAVCAIVLAVAIPAIGHKVKYPTNLQLKIDTVNDTTDQFSGKVTSTKGACVVGRTITVFVAGAPVAVTVSNVAGDWAVTGPTAPQNTDVTATTPRKILKKNRKHRHKCAAAATTRKATGPPGH